MELKSAFRLALSMRSLCFNRTFMELKWADGAYQDKDGVLMVNEIANEKNLRLIIELTPRLKEIGRKIVVK